MLLSLGTQLRLRYFGWRTGEEACNTGEKVFRKAAEVCNAAADKCAEGTKKCKEERVKAKGMLRLYDDPDSREVLVQLLTRKRKRDEEADEELRQLLEQQQGDDDAEAFEEELALDEDNVQFTPIDEPPELDENTSNAYV